MTHEELQGEYELYTMGVAEDPARLLLSSGLERVRASHRPGVAEARILGAIEQLTGPQGRVQLVE